MGTVLPVGGDPFELAAGCIALATPGGRGEGGISQQFVTVMPANPPTTQLFHTPVIQMELGLRYVNRGRTRFLACIKLSVVRLHILWSI